MKAPKQSVCVIYALADPRTDQVCYVGRTKDIEARYRMHRLAHTHGLVKAWESTLREVGLEPTLHILEEGISFDLVEERERYWIAKKIAEGCPLLNLMAGGSVWGWIKVPDSVRQNISKSMRELWQDPEFHDERVRKMTAALADPEVRRKISEAVRGRIASDETRELISRTMTELWADPEYAEHQREAVAQAASDLWKREGFRELHAESMQREDTRAKISEAARKMWADPEIRAKLTAE